MVMNWAGRGAAANFAQRLGLDRAAIESVCREYGVTESELKSRFRTRRIAWPRQEVYRRLYDLGCFSMPQIARMFNRKDHTTVLKGIRRARERMKCSA